MTLQNATGYEKNNRSILSILINTYCKTRSLDAYFYSKKSCFCFKQYTFITSISQNNTEKFQITDDVTVQIYVLGIFLSNWILFLVFCKKKSKCRPLYYLNWILFYIKVLFIVCVTRRGLYLIGVKRYNAYKNHIFPNNALYFFRRL